MDIISGLLGALWQIFLWVVGIGICIFCMWLAGGMGGSGGSHKDD